MRFEAQLKALRWYSKIVVVVVVVVCVCLFFFFGGGGGGGKPKKRGSGATKQGEVVGMDIPIPPTERRCLKIDDKLFFDIVI